MARRRKKTYAEKVLEETLESGLGVVEPECAYFGECGGCAWQCIEYDRQLEYKRAWIEQAFRENGFDELTVPEPIPSPILYRYRNKMEFSFSARRWLTRKEIDSGEELRRDFALGLHAKGAFDRVLDVTACPIQSETADAYLAATREFALASGEPPYHLREHTGFFRYLILRYGFHTDDVAVVLVTTERKPEVMRAYVDHLRARGLEPTIVANGVTDSVASTSEGSEIFIDAGDPTFTEKLGSAVFALEPDAFFQPNTFAAEKLVEIVEEYAALRGRETVLDLYCGVGVLSILLASKASQVIGIEKVKTAVESARRNAEANDAANVYFVVGNLDEGIPHLPGVRPNVVVTDPPRAGMHARTIAALKDLAPERIVSVSCHPVPQAENVAALCENDDYYVAEMQPVDLFPHTPHIENVALLIRN